MLNGFWVNKHDNLHEEIERRKAVEYQRELLSGEIQPSDDWRKAVTRLQNRIVKLECQVAKLSASDDRSDA